MGDAAESPELEQPDDVSRSAARNALRRRDADRQPGRRDARAVETLRACDRVAAEDTRRTRQLLTHLGIVGQADRRAPRALVASATSRGSSSALAHG